MAVTFQLLTAASPSGACPGVLSRSDARRQTTPLGSVLVQPSGQVFDDPMLILAHRLDLRSRIARLDYAGRFRRASAWRTMTGAYRGYMFPPCRTIRIHSPKPPASEPCCDLNASLAVGADRGWAVP
jgi:hypothetical protein